MRFRRVVVQEPVRYKNQTAGMLIEQGGEYERRRWYGKRYFPGAGAGERLVDPYLRPLLEFNRQQIDTLGQMDQRVIRMLEQHAGLQQRIEALQSIHGSGRSRR